MHGLQTARGTALKKAPQRGDPARRRRLLALFATVAVGGYALDQASKQWATNHLTGRPDVPLVGDWFTLHLVYNPGAAFSLGTGITPFLTLLAIAAVGAIVWWSRRIGTVWWAVSMGALLAGVAGNLTDRLLRDPGPMRGHVVDFLRLPNWPVFNFADIFINFGGIMVVIAVLRGVEIDGSRATSGEAQHESER